MTLYSIGTVNDFDGEDPFTFPLERFQSLGEDPKAALVERASILARARVEREFERRRVAWLILVGGDVVAASSDVTTLPSPEEVLRYGEPTGRVAYLFEAPLIEEVLAASRAESEVTDTE